MGFSHFLLAVLLTVPMNLLADISLPEVLMPETAPKSLAVQHTTTTDLSAEKAAQITKLLKNKLEAEKLPSLTTSIVLNGQLVWTQALGTADLEHNVSAHQDTVYRSASLVKPITATAIMQLVEAGLVELDTPVQEYCQHFPEKAYEVTIGSLLTHTAGIRTYPKARDAYLQEVYNTKHYASIIAALEIFAHDPLLFKPSTDHKYTSYGYNLLGCIIEGVTGKKWQNYLKAYIFNPSGMNATRIDDPTAIIPDRAAYYARNYQGELKHARYADLSSRSPGAGLVTTAPDMMRFVTALFNEKLLSATTFQQMLEPTFLNNGDVISYGLGWGLNLNDEFYGLKEVSHGGMVPGVSSMLYLLPEQQFATIIITNLSGVEGRMELVRDIAKIVLNLPLTTNTLDLEELSHD